MYDKDKAIKRQNDFNKSNYDRLNTTIPKGRKADIVAYCDSIGTTPNGLINELLRFELGFTPEQWKERATAEE